MKKFLLLLLTLLLMGSIASAGAGCKNQNVDDDGYVTTDTGLKYKDITVGEGDMAKAGDNVSVHYVGTLENGTKFDSSVDRGTPFEFNLGAGEVIAGWDEGVAGMQIGGKRELVIPSDLGYGEGGYPGVIPGGATLIFEVELIEIL